MVFIARYLELKQALADEEYNEKFADEEAISQWAKQAVGVVEKLGIISGKENNMFAPMDNTTRGEAAKMLVGLMDVIEKDEK